MEEEGSITLDIGARGRQLPGRVSIIISLKPKTSGNHPLVAWGRASRFETLFSSPPLGVHVHKRPHQCLFNIIFSIACALKDCYITMYPFPHHSCNLGNDINGGKQSVKNKTRPQVGPRQPQQVQIKSHSCFLSSVHCPFSANPTSIELTKYKRNLICQSKETLFDPTNMVGVQVTHLFSASTMLNPPCSIQDRVSLSQRHPFRKVGHNCDFEIRC